MILCYHKLISFNPFQLFMKFIIGKYLIMILEFYLMRKRFSFHLTKYLENHYTLIFKGYILIFASSIKCHKKDDSKPLRCYKCGQGNFPPCTYFNGSEVFVTICPKDQKSCLKGWVNGSGGSSSHKKSEHLRTQTSLGTYMIRSCAPIAENICLKQNAGKFLLCIC